MCCNEGWYRKVEYVTLTDIFINTVSTHVLPAEIVYADDVDFVSHSVQLLREHETRAASTLAGWSLAVNQSRTEYAHIFRGKDRIEKEWRAVRKLGSRMGAEEDVASRKQLAAVAYKLWPLWKRRDKVREALRIRLYNAFIMPVHTYNCSTWGVPKIILARLDSFHRRQLRSLIGVRWPQKISNEKLYERCGPAPHSEFIKKMARWRFFGHVLRLPREAPAQLALEWYLNIFCNRKIAGWRGRPRCNLAAIII